MLLVKSGINSRTMQTRRQNYNSAPDQASG